MIKLHAWVFENWRKMRPQNWGSKYDPNFGVTFCFFFKQDNKKTRHQKWAQNASPIFGPILDPQDQFWMPSLARLLARSLARSASLAHLLGRWFVRNLMAYSLGTSPPLVRSLAGTSLTDSLACLLAGWLAGWLACLLALL